MSNKALDDKQEHRLARQYVDGVSGCKLAKEWGIDTRTVYNILKRQEITIRSVAEALRKTTADDDREIIQLYMSEFMPSTEIAKKYNICKATVIKIIKQYGVGILSRNERGIHRLLRDGVNDKLCLHCGILKPRNEFANNQYSIDGKSTYCKICINEMQCKYRKKHPRKVHQWDRDNRHKRREGQEHGDGFSIEEYESMWEKQNGRCFYCGEQMIRSGNWHVANYCTIDHVKPLSGGGLHQAENIVLACNKCNITKSNKSVEIFIETMNYRQNERNTQICG